MDAKNPKPLGSEILRKQALLKSASQASKKQTDPKKSPQKAPALANRQVSPPTKTPTGTILLEFPKSNPPSVPPTMTASANKLFQEAKTQLEQSGNLKTTIKESVIASLSGMYEIVLRMTEAKQTLQKQLERARSQHADELLRREKEYETRLKSPAESTRQDEAKETLQEIRREVEAVKQILINDVVNPKINKGQPTSASKEQETNSNQLITAINENIKIMTDSRSQMTDLNDNMSQLRTDINGSSNNKITYAEMVARQHDRNVATAPMHTIIVSSEDDQDTSQTVIDKIRTAVDAKNSGVRVDRVRKAKDQKVVLSCQSKEDLEKITAKIKNPQNHLRVESMKNKDPLVIIKDVLSFNTDEDIVTAIKNQNGHLLSSISPDDLRVEVKYRKKARNPHENHLVLRVSPKVWQRLTSAGRVQIDLQRVRVQDQSPLIQCSRCLGYGHGRKLCCDTVDLCSHCAGPHLRADCPSWLAGEAPACRNCHTAKYDKTEHNAFDNECPIRKKWDAIARSSVAYC